MRERQAKVFGYAGTDTGDARVGRWSRTESGQKTTAMKAGPNKAGGEDGAGSISKLRNNKQRSLGTD